MLASCRAYVVAQSVAQNRSLVRLAERSGFGFVGSVLGDRRVAIEAERGEIVYFLIHHRLSDDTMAAIIKLLRSNASDAIRYAPIVMIIDDCPFETILKYVQFGFDDIISLPEKREIIIDRLRKQLNSEHCLDNLLNMIMDAVIDLTGAERGFIILRGDGNREVVAVYRRR